MERSASKKIIELYKGKKTSALIKNYANIFPHCYIDAYPIEVAINDLSYIEKLSAENPLEIDFYDTAKQTYPLSVRLFLWNRPKALSIILPMLENLGLCTYSVGMHDLTLSRDQSIWVCDFSVCYTNGTFEIDKASTLFKTAFKQIYLGFAENDGFNKLVLGASLAWHEVMVLRAYARYLQQIHFRYTQAYIEKTLVRNTDITKVLIDLFKKMHDPSKKAKNQNGEMVQEVLQRLEAVSSLDEDLIIRQVLALMKATLRTNYFQLANNKKPKEYLSLKFCGNEIPELPLPIPLYGIFVYSPQFEGIHLRSAKVARGGIRWSERLEDFRTEVLGLMKAQKVKNAVIVPSGAKGGFILKNN